MALVRILVDGYNLLAYIQRQGNFRCNQAIGLLHHWPELAEGAPRHSEAARDALVDMLQQYQDASGMPVTIFFDGRGSRKTRPKNESGSAVEVLFSSAGQTADDLIERAAHRFQEYGEVLVVTDDMAERETVSGFGGLVASSGNFIAMIQNALADLQEKINNLNRSERDRFRRSG